MVSYVINDDDLWLLSKAFERASHVIGMHKYLEAYVIRDYRKPMPMVNQIIWSGFDKQEAEIQHDVEKMRAALLMLESKK